VPRDARRDAELRTSGVSGFLQSSARHPQISQSEQRHDLGGVLHQATIPGLCVAKLALEDSEWVFDFGTDAGLQAFDLIVYRVQSIA
jgi:hypothetical protein